MQQRPEQNTLRSQSPSHCGEGLQRQSKPQSVSKKRNSARKEILTSQEKKKTCFWLQKESIQHISKPQKATALTTKQIVHGAFVYGLRGRGLELGKLGIWETETLRLTSLKMQMRSLESCKTKALTKSKRSSPKECLRIPTK